MNKENIIMETSEKFINSKTTTRKNKNITISEIELNKKLAEQIGKSKGKYFTIFFNNINGLVEQLIKEIIYAINESMKYLKINKKDKILLVGLGNKDITSDSLGYFVINKIDVNDNTYKIYKNVESITNINSTSFVKNIANLLNVDLVIVIDSLSATNIERLNKTIQISTSGIKPGSAFNTISDEISKKTIKKPVIAIGVPTIINMQNIIKNKNENLILTSKNIDLDIDNISSILSIAINRIF